MRSNNYEEQVLNYLLTRPDALRRPVTEAVLAEHFGLSPTPIREALNTLEAKGFVERKQRKGTYLRAFSIREISELYDLRALLEGLAARLLCGVVTPGVLKQLKNIDTEYEKKNNLGRKYGVLSEVDCRFHLLILDSCKGRRTASLVKDFHLITKTLKNSMAPEYFSQPNSPHPSPHSKIIQTLEERDAHAAEDAARRHVEYGKENTINTMIQLGIGGP